MEGPVEPGPALSYRTHFGFTPGLIFEEMGGFHQCPELPQFQFDGRPTQLIDLELVR
jgi:hypothetical protein